MELMIKTHFDDLNEPLELASTDIDEVDSISEDESKTRFKDPATVWADRISKKCGRLSRNTRSKKSVLKSELSSYMEETMKWLPKDCEAREFWCTTSKAKKWPNLTKLARLFLSIPASSIPQEKQFSELKRRSTGLRTRTKIETLDRDAVVFSWINKN